MMLKELGAGSREQSCTFTGHRPAKLAWGCNEADSRCIDLKMRIFDTVEALYNSGIRHYICGMANGCDMYFCEAVIKLRAEKKGVTLEAAIPWEGQSSSWSERDRKRYNRLVENCDYYTIVQSEYSPDCALKRNRYMVDNARVLVAAYNGTHGGTMKTMLYAMRQGVEIIELPI